MSSSPVELVSPNPSANGVPEVEIVPAPGSAQANVPEVEGEQNNDDVFIKNKRPKTSSVWAHFDVIDIAGGKKKAVCRYCKNRYSTGGKGSSTSHLKRHVENCLQKRLQTAPENKQIGLPFQPSNAGNPFLNPNVRYSMDKVREMIAGMIMVHEQPFSVVEDDYFMWLLQYSNSDFQKYSRKTARSDCIALYEAEKKKLKNLLKSVSKISLTTDMWKSSHQVVEYMVVTGHFIDAGWNLQKRVLSFVNVPAPRRGVDVADAIFKCLKAWGIENKVFSVSVDNASYNDSCLKTLKDNLSLNNKLVLGGSLFHVRCCAHILNLLVQDGLNQIKNITHNIRESVKYINHNDARLKVFVDLVEQKGLKERKLILDCPTRWNSTFYMLSAASKFKTVFSSYQDREPHYKYAPSVEDWDKVEKICQFLHVFNLATHSISGTEYPTANLYLAEVWKVKQVIDNALDGSDEFMNKMAEPMKVKFDKYWGECNLLMSIGSVLDPRVKFHLINHCFPMIYKSEENATNNIQKVRDALQELYDEYVSLGVEETSSSSEAHVGGCNNSSSSNQTNSSIVTGLDEILNFVREQEAIPQMKSELQVYLDEVVCIPEGDKNSFSALDWWKNNSTKYKILSRMAADVLAVPISTVASESTFSAGGRVIDEYRSRLNDDSIEALICGGDWLRQKYNIKRKSKVVEKREEINLKI